MFKLKLLTASESSGRRLRSTGPLSPLWPWSVTSTCRRSKGGLASYCSFRDFPLGGGAKTRTTVDVMNRFALSKYHCPDSVQAQVLCSYLICAVSQQKLCRQDHQVKWLGSNTLSPGVIEMLALSDKLFDISIFLTVLTSVKRSAWTSTEAWQKCSFRLRWCHTLSRDSHRKVPGLSNSKGNVKVGNSWPWIRHWAKQLPHVHSNLRNGAWRWDAELWVAFWPENIHWIKLNHLIVRLKTSQNHKTLTWCDFYTFQYLCQAQSETSDLRFCHPRTHWRSVLVWSESALPNLESSCLTCSTRNAKVKLIWTIATFASNHLRSPRHEGSTSRAEIYHGQGKIIACKRLQIC